MSRCDQTCGLQAAVSKACRSRVSKSAVISMAAGVLMLASGCATKIEYGDAQAVETVDTTFGSTDLQQVAAKMVDSLLSFPPIVELTRQQRPVMFVDRVKNKTSEHIDVESVTDTIVNKLLRSGKFRFLDMSNQQGLQAQLAHQSQSGLVDPNKAVAIGRQFGAQYMVYGNLSSITKQNKKTKDVYYKFTLKVQNIETGLLEWQDEKEIRKQASRSVFGL